MNKLVIAAVGALAFAGAAQAQEVFNQVIQVNQPAGDATVTPGFPGYALSNTFVLPTAEAVVIDGIGSLNSEIIGSAYIVSASAPTVDLGGFNGNQFVGPAYDTFSTPISLAAGTYQVAYSFVDANGSSPESVDLQVDATSAPEIDPASAASGLTLLAGALLVLRGRRRTTSAVSFA